MANVSESDRARVGIEVARRLLDRLGELLEVDPSVVPLDPAMVLHSILRRRPDGSPDPIAQPLIPLLDTTLLTNAPGEPNLWNRPRRERTVPPRIPTAHGPWIAVRGTALHSSSGRGVAVGVVRDQ